MTPHHSHGSGGLRSTDSGPAECWDHGEPERHCGDAGQVEWSGLPQCHGEVAGQRPHNRILGVWWMQREGGFGCCCLQFVRKELTEFGWQLGVPANGVGRCCCLVGCHGHGSEVWANHDGQALAECCPSCHRIAPPELATRAWRIINYSYKLLSIIPHIVVCSTIILQPPVALAPSRSMQC